MSGGPDTSRISPTAHYTGYVWVREGLADPRMATRSGRILHALMAPVARMGSRFFAGYTLDDTLLQRHRIIDALLDGEIAAGARAVVEIAAGLSPRGQRITAASWRALLADTSAGQAAELLWMSVVQGESAARMQWRLARRLYRKATRTFRMSMFNFGVVAAFFHIKRAELADLLQVVGILTYGLPAQDLHARLVTRRED